MIAECAGSVSVKAMGKLLSGAGGERRELNDGTVLLSPMLPCGKCDENATYRGQKRGWFCNRLSAVYALCQFFAETQVDEKDVYLSSMTIIRPQVQIEFTPTAVFSRIGGVRRQQRKAFERLNSVASRARISTSLRR